MKAMRYLATLCGALCALTISASAAERPIGTAVGVPSWELDSFVRANNFPPSGQPANNVTVLHTSPEFNAAIVTVAVTERSTGQPSGVIYVPTYGSDALARIYRQINDQDAWSLGQKVGSSISSVLKVRVSQPNTGSYEPGVTRFLMVPSEALAAILDVNPGAKLAQVHQQRAHIGSANLAVELLAVEGTSSLQILEQIPGVSLAREIAGLNANVSLRATAVTDRGAMATIEVR
jgi:hypothetical protein